ncbi:MAG: ChaN family lipoprotein [Planctomycetota bacterium]
MNRLIPLLVPPLLLLATIAACESLPAGDPPPEPAEPPAKKWQPPGPLANAALTDSVWVCDQNGRQAVTLEAMLDAAAKKEVVFLGETHLDETTHELELAVYEGLIERTQGKVVLALEMFERDDQTALDEYLAGKIEEPAFRMRTRVWGNYRTGYRRLIETAKKHGLPVVGSNAPAMLRRKVGMGGRKALDALPPEERKLLPDELHDNTDAYWERVARAVRGHMMFRPSPEARVTSAQCLWDNSMGDSCVQALARYPDHVVLHINGAFHTQFRDGTVHQMLLRRPDTKYTLMEAVAADEFYGFDPFGAEKRADYLVFVKRRAGGLSEGFHSVIVTPELRYRLRLPPHVSDEKPVPLLIWLPDDGFRAADGLSLWAAALGNEAAIAVVEAPYPFVDEDLVQGGRWYWAETFNKDLGMLESGLGSLYAYILRHFPIDPDRVVIAGEGTGATIVAATSLYASGSKAKYLATAPRRFGKLRMLGLPAPAERGHLKLFPLEADQEWWDKEAADYRKAGVKVDLEEASANGWERLQKTEDVVRATLKLPERTVEEDAEPTVLILETDTPRARDWAHRYALRLDGKVTVASPDEAEDGKLLSFGEGGVFSPQDLLDGRGLPLAAGPFGGTTILLVPKEASEEQQAAWKELQEKKALRKRSRFHRLVVVIETDEDTGLADAFEAVRAAGRRSVLVVPAVFCADAASMRRWREEVKEYEDLLDLGWSPGLGGNLYRLLAKKK